MSGPRPTSPSAGAYTFLATLLARAKVILVVSTSGTHRGMCCQCRTINGLSRLIYWAASGGSKADWSPIKAVIYWCSYRSHSQSNDCGARHISRLVNLIWLRLTRQTANGANSIITPCNAHCIWHRFLPTRVPSFCSFVFQARASPFSTNSVRPCLRSY